MDTCVGIDLGTTNTVTAVVHDGLARALMMSERSVLLPSVVSFEKNGEVLVGAAARARKLQDFSHTVHSIKRLIGRTWDSPEVTAARRELPFSLVRGVRDSVMVQIDDRLFALPEISAYVLRHARITGEEIVRTPVMRAVITVPANFNELQRASTQMAARLADLEVLRILNEPTAAALAYGQTLQGAKRVAIYDLGGGTFDLTILDLTKEIFEVLATAGDSNLGGDDLDTACAELIRKRCLDTLGTDPRDDAETWVRVQILAEQWKTRLSTEETIDEVVEEVLDRHGVARALPIRLTRADLERAAVSFIDRTLEVTSRALTSARLRPSDIHEVLLVGGATRMPLVQGMVGDFFGRTPVAEIDPDQVVAIGAAIAASSLGRRPLAPPTAPPKHTPTVRRAPTPPPSGGVLGRIALVRRSARPNLAIQEVPAQPRPELSITELPQSPATPQVRNVVAVREKPPLLLDVTPLTLRIETAGGFSDALLAANTPIPCEVTRVFSTSVDDQHSVQVRVAQGELRTFADNTFLGEIVLGDLPPGPRGSVKISVTFELDANGTMRVRATDPSGREAQTTIRLLGITDDDDEVEAMADRHGRSTLIT